MTDQSPQLPIEDDGLSQASFRTTLDKVHCDTAAELWNAVDGYLAAPAQGWLWCPDGAHFFADGMPDDLRSRRILQAELMSADQTISVRIDHHDGDIWDIRHTVIGEGEPCLIEDIARLTVASAPGPMVHRTVWTDHGHGLMRPALHCFIGFAKREED